MNGKLDKLIEKLKRTQQKIEILKKKFRINNNCDKDFRLKEKLQKKLEKQ